MAAPDDVAQLQARELSFSRWLAELIGVRRMIDVGAHQGATLAPFLQAGWDVIAFEPIESNRQALQECCSNSPALTLRPEAVSDVSGTRQFHLALKPDGSLHEYYHSLERIGDDRHHRKGAVVPVSVVSLDDLLARGEIPAQVGFLKIDAEGHDLAVLRGAARLDCEVVGVEFWREGLPLGESPSPAQAMIRLMAERGYDRFLVVCHHPQETIVLRSTFEGARADAWGNIFFFKSGPPKIYEQVLSRLDTARKEAAAEGAPTGPPHDRLHTLLGGALNGRETLRFLDVGAYQGDFTADLLRAFPAAQGILFEPNPVCFRALKERYAGKPGIRIEPFALSHTPRTASYYVAPEAYNNSLLPPATGPATTIQVPVETIDRLRQQTGEPVGLIKIDAQGHDLQILKGALQTLRRDQPAVLVEAIFIELYEQQDGYHEILQLMIQEGYHLAALLNAHATQAGLLAFADLLFFPAALQRRLSAHQGAYVCEEPDLLLRRNRVLQNACDERLALIQRLSAKQRTKQRTLMSRLKARVRTFLTRPR